MGRGCLFWLLVSVISSVTLTVLANLVLFVLSGMSQTPTYSNCVARTTPS
jgi:hypothetical protein